MAAVPEVRIVNEIPDAVKKLASLIARSFYGFPHGLIVDLLKRNTVLKESQIQDTTKFDVKQLRSILIMLKQDKIIKERQRVEEGTNGKSVKINYYFINYRAVINITKYKIDHMRRKLESEELTNTHRASYRCSKCSTPFSDLEIDRLMDFSTGLMVCFHCRGEVVEDDTAGPSESTRSSLAKFNEQMCPFFGLLQELDGVQLSPHLLEPVLPDVVEESGNTDQGKRSSGVPFGSHIDGGYRGQKQFQLYQQQQGVDVKIEDSQKTTEDTTKQVPIWLQNETLPGTSQNPAEENTVAVTGLDDIVVKNEVIDRTEEEEIVARTLRAHENGSAGKTNSDVKVKLEENAGASADSDGQNKKESEGEGDESSEDELEDVVEEVHVQGVAYSFADIVGRPELVNEMTPEEKAEYIRISQSAMDSMY